MISIKLNGIHIVSIDSGSNNPTYAISFSPEKNETLVVSETSFLIDAINVGHESSTSRMTEFILSTRLSSSLISYFIIISTSDSLKINLANSEIDELLIERCIFDNSSATIEEYVPLPVMMSIAWRALSFIPLRAVDSESAHSIAMSALSNFGERPSGQFLLNRLYRAPELPVEVFGKLFHHPLGLAAGFDKGAEALLAWSAMGFSWCEYGGITRFPQDGNPKPRMFRANKHKALVNRMGFNNPGASEVCERLSSRKISGNWPKFPIAANIGRSKKVKNEHAADDYYATMDLLWDHADIFVLNISSPNTPGLRDLQGEAHLSTILDACNSLREKKEEQKPILLKLSPDTNDDLIKEIVRTSVDRKIDGFVAINTTVKRPKPLSTQSRRAFANDGGLSGRPLQKRSSEVIGLVYRETGGELPIVGVGGIDSVESAWDAIISGASLIQIYSSLVFNGPSTVKAIVKGLKKKIRDSEFSGIMEAVGTKYI